MSRKYYIGSKVSKEKAQISKETVKYLGGRVSFLRDNEVFLN